MNAAKISFILPDFSFSPTILSANVTQPLHSTKSAWGLPAKPTNSVNPTLAYGADTTGYSLPKGLPHPKFQSLSWWRAASKRLGVIGLRLPPQNTFPQFLMYDWLGGHIRLCYSQEPIVFVILPSQMDDPGARVHIKNLFECDRFQIVYKFSVSLSVISSSASIRLHLRAL